MSKRTRSAVGAGLLLAVASFGLGLTLLLAAVKFAEEPPAGAVRLAPVEGLGVEVPPALRTTVFYPQEAKLKAWLAGDCRVETSELGERESAIREYLLRRRPCAADGQKIRVKVRGYASSSMAGGWSEEEFTLQNGDCAQRWKSCLKAQNCEWDGSREKPLPCVAEAFNLCVANARSEHVTSQIQRWLKDEGGWLKIEPARWASYEEMKFGHLTDDLRCGAYDHRVGILNRRAELEIVDVGSCVVAVPSLGEEGGVQTEGRQGSMRERAAAPLRWVDGLWTAGAKLA